MRNKIFMIAAFLSFALSGCSSTDATRAHDGASTPSRPMETRSLLGEPLRRPALSGEVSRQREAQLEEAREALRRNPESESASIWVGRRLAYLGRIPERVGAGEARCCRQNETWQSPSVVACPQSNGVSWPASL